MYVRFSQRMGLQPVRSVIQVDSLDQDTRTELWNFSLTAIEASLQGGRFSASSKLLTTMWTDLWRQPADELPMYASESVSRIKAALLTSDWASAYDLIEFICQFFGIDTIAAAYNEILERNLCGYRFIQLQLAPVVSDTEVAAIERTLEDLHASDVVRHHLTRALDLLADRADPDYANSVKESISAVEAQLKAITGVSPMGPAVDALRVQSPELHAAMARSWKSLYGYASD